MIKKLFGIFFSVAILFVVGVGNLSAAEYYIDNDNAGSAGANYSSGNWIYGSASYCYRGDYRISADSNSGYVYMWYVNTTPPNLYGSSGYVNHASFTGDVIYNSSGQSTGVLVQAWMPGGWSTIFYKDGGAWAGSQKYVRLNSQGAGRVGADGAYVRDQ